MLDTGRKGLVFVVVVAGHVAVFAMFVFIRPNERFVPERTVSTLLFIETEPNSRKSSSSPRRARDKSRIAVQVPTIVEDSTASNAPLAIPQVATDAANGLGPEGYRSLDSKPKTIDLSKSEQESDGMFPVGPRREGKSYRSTTGESITWISDTCYATTPPATVPQLLPNKVNVICVDPYSSHGDLFNHLKPSYLMKPDEKRVRDPRAENADNLP